MKNFFDKPWVLLAFGAWFFYGAYTRIILELKRPDLTRPVGYIWTVILLLFAIWYTVKFFNKILK